MIAHLLIELFFAIAGATGVTVAVREWRRASADQSWGRDA